MPLLEDLKLQKLLTALLLLTFAPVIAWSMPILDENAFAYEGTCRDSFFANCAFIGLSSGDGVSGLISFTDLDENRVIEAREITSWDFVFGDAMFDRSSHWLSGALILNADGTGFGGFLGEGLFFTPKPNGAGTIYSGVTGSLFFGALDGWVVRACRGSHCRNASGGGAYTALSEPGSLMLFGMGLLAVAAVRRRRVASK